MTIQRSSVDRILIPPSLARLSREPANGRVGA
jgi:hypothetical protein